MKLLSTKDKRKLKTRSMGFENDKIRFRNLHVQHNPNLTKIKLKYNQQKKTLKTSTSLLNNTNLFHMEILQLFTRFDKS